ncbi:hypothetical protein M3Y98_00111800 [Aphelenchoides besseyi]|nr:hypothetical protein M3Y98_00111800 [Aphelenchoides besseyi]
MVILRQERIFSYAGKGKFSECWLMVVYDMSGPAILLFKDQTAKKLIYERLHVPSLAAQMRFGTTAVSYGEVPEPKNDPKIDTACLIAIQVERRVKKTVQPQVMWLCATSTKQLFALLKILACGLSIMEFPAPAPRSEADHPSALHHYRPRWLVPENAWEIFWENPPDARLVTSLEIAKNLAKSVDQLNLPPPPKAVVESPVIKSQSASALDIIQRQRSVSSSGSSTTVSSRGSNRRRSSIPIYELALTQDMPRTSYSPQRIRKYERQESARASPIIRQIERQQKRAIEEEPRWTARTQSTPPPAPPLPIPVVVHKKPVPTAPVEVRHYDEPPVEEVETPQNEHKYYHLHHPHHRYEPEPQIQYRQPEIEHVHRIREEPLVNIYEPKHYHPEHQHVHSPKKNEHPHHHVHSHKHDHPVHQHTAYPHRRSHSVDIDRRPPHSPSILRRQPTPKQQTFEESPPQTQRAISGHSSGYVTPSHLDTMASAYPPSPPQQFEVELLRRMSELSLRPLRRSPSPPIVRHQHIIEKPIQKRQTAVPLEEVQQVEIMLDENHHRPHNEFLPPTRRISDVERYDRPRARRRRSQTKYFSRGVQTDHLLPEPPLPLISNYEFARARQYDPYTIESSPQLYRKISHQSNRSIYIRHLEDTCADYDTISPFFRAGSSCDEIDREFHGNYDLRRVSEPRVDVETGTRTYIVEVDQQLRF